MVRSATVAHMISRDTVDLEENGKTRVVFISWSEVSDDATRLNTLKEKRIIQIRWKGVPPYKLGK